MNTPQTSTFYHRSVLLAEAVDALNIRPDGMYVDATFGGGGHTREILSRLGPKGRVLAFDQDSDAWSNAPEDERLTLIPENFRWLNRFLRLHGLRGVDGILADLGVSSHQFNEGSRGFSTRFDGPLDMRMDQRGSLTAAQVVATYPEEKLHRLFEQYGEVRNARQLAAHLVASRKSNPVHDTAAFRSLLAPVIKGNPNRYLAQVYQALRIEVNAELQALEALLAQSATALKQGGRLVIISFHSLEDRIVKQFIKDGPDAAQDAGSSLTGRQEREELFKNLSPKPILPTEAEQAQNPRARSARMRVAEKL